GRCCLVKLEDADDCSRTYFTDVGCRLLDSKTCRCRDYPNRTARVKDCVRLTPRNVKRIVWLPPSCAYRRLAEGHDLYWWHPLVSGDPETVHQAGISVRGRVGASEDDVAEDALEDRAVAGSDPPWLTAAACLPHPAASASRPLARAAVSNGSSVAGAPAKLLNSALASGVRRSRTNA